MKAIKKIGRPPVVGCSAKRNIQFEREQVEAMHLIAKKRGTTMTALVRQFVSAGLGVYKVGD